MSGAIFQSELSSLIQESKRKHPDVKAAAEKSLTDLKSLPVTSEAQLAGDLLRKHSFLDPFVLACKSRNAKLASSAVICLQRLAASRAIPSQRLKDVLEAFREVTSSGFDVQIKILQTLPSLLQTYASDLHGNLLYVSLEICGALQSSKTTVVSSTASATLQQLVSSAFERIGDEDDDPDSEILREVKIENEIVKLSRAASDGFEIFGDLCRIADGAAPIRLKSGTIAQIFVLDLILTVLGSNEKVFHTHHEMLSICRNKLMPALLRRLSAKSTFPITIRSLKILYLLISRHIEALQDESETAWGLLLHLLEPEAAQSWKRAACLEVIRDVISNVSLVCRMFDCFDMKKGHKNIVSQIMAALTKIAAEEPTIIGLSNQSTIPARHADETQEGQEQASLEAAGVEDVIGSTVTADSHITGISALWSRPKTPYLEQLDKNDASSLPDTYIYSLVLDCLSSLSEGLAKFVMPMSVARNERKKTQATAPQPTQVSNDKKLDSGRNGIAIEEAPAESQKAPRLVNPLSLTSHPQSESIKTAAALVTSCWPAFLATCATFLNATLDPEFYHNLVRAVQKLAQVAGVLELSTPRDAFLTTLAKGAIPPQALQPGQATEPRQAEVSPFSKSADRAGSTVNSPVSKFAPESRMFSRSDVAQLTTRNLLCMRALLNLGIALGPTLSQEAWCILLETLKEAEFFMKASSRMMTNQNAKLAEETSGTENNTIRTNLGGEIAAVQTASKKMFASTASYDTNVFLGLLRALFSLSVSTQSVVIPTGVASPTESSDFHRAGRMHQPSRSTSSSSFKVAIEDDEVLFVLSKINETARSNLQRLVRDSAEDSGWSLITNRLLQIIGSRYAVSETRLRAANLLDTVILGTLQILDGEDLDEDLHRDVQYRGVSALRRQIDGLYKQSAAGVSESRKFDLDIHERAIETLVSIIEQHGENLMISWKTIFELGGTVFEEQEPAVQSDTHQDIHIGGVRARSVKLISIAFRLLQLIGSDFLTLLPVQDLLDFVEILLLFGRQHEDLNVSLTSTTFFWNLADFVLSGQDHHPLIDLTEVPTEASLVDQIDNNADPKDVIESLWLVLLLRLNILTIDSRSEVRNGAIRVTLRILDASGPFVSPRGWYICLSFILLRLLKSHASMLGRIRQRGSEIDQKSFEEWYASTVALVEGCTNLVGHFIHTMIAEERFLVFWEDFLEVLESVLAIPSLAVSFAAFHGLTSIFSCLTKVDYSDVRVADPAVRLWIRRHPADIVSLVRMEDVSTIVHDSNQKALTAHAETLVRITEALPSVNLNQIAAQDILLALRKTIIRSLHPPYGSDIHKMAPEQERIMEILQLLSKARTSNTIEYYQTLFDFILIACQNGTDTPKEPEIRLSAIQGRVLQNGQIPSFVAFASKCVDLLESEIIKTVQHEALKNNSFNVRSALKVLSDTIKAKYSPKAHRGDPILWRKATNSVCALVEAVGSRSYRLVEGKEIIALNEVYGSAIEAAVGILGSGGLKDMDQVPEESAILADEEHDMSAFKRLSLTLIPALTKLKDSDVASHPSLASQIHKHFVISLFHASMIAVPQYGDLPSEKDLMDSPLSSLLQVRPGTIKKVVYHIRSNIPYLALDTMFKLIAAFKDDRAQGADAFAGRLALARIAAPYVLFRSAHTLKSFISDQPLRGSMSMPSKLRTELLHVLRSCLELRSQDEAFVGKPGTHNCLGHDGKRHLRVLHPLILQMWKVWRRVPRFGFSWTTDDDGIKIEKCLHQWMELCGKNWELATFNS